MALKRKIEYYKFDGNENIKIIQEKLQKIIKDKNYYNDYNSDNIDFYYFNIFSDVDEAMKMIKMLDNGDYHQLAVRYKEENEHPITKLPQMKELQNKKEKHLEHLKNIEERASIKTFKSQFRKCKGCGSSLARDLLEDEFCPLCGTDLRGTTYRKQMAKVQKNIDNVDKSIAALYRRYNIDDLGYTVKWLIKIEYMIDGE